MKVYRLGIGPREDEGDGEDRDEYFSSLAAARHRRAQLIRQDPGLLGGRYRNDYEIERLTVTDGLTLRHLILALLNRRGWAEHREEVVPPYEPSGKVVERETLKAAEAEERLLD